MGKVIRQYYTGDYNQKSMVMLLPLVESDWKTIRGKGLMNTYLYCDGIEESIVDNFLLVEFKKGTDYGGNQYTKASYLTEEGTEVLVYSLDHVADDVQKFLSGYYSKYSDSSKKRVLEYYGHKPPPKPLDVKNGIQHSPGWYVILYPDLFVDEISEEFWKRFGWYNTFEEAYDVVKTMGEMFGLFDLKKETLDKKIIE